MSKKGRVLGKDPLFWVRDTRQEKPDAGALPPDDTPTTPSGPEPSAAAGPPAAQPSSSPPAAAATPPAPVSVARPPAASPLGYFPTAEIREPRGAFLLVVLLNMLLLLALGVIGFLYLNGRIGHLEQRLDRLDPPAPTRPAGPAR